MRLRTLDLFCGGGGSSWGAKAAGAEILCGVDAWSIAAETFNTNFARKSVHKKLDENSGPKSIGLSDDIDLILSSPECTNHTCAKGSRERDESSKRTATYVTNFARELRPRWIVLENVIQMRSWHGYRPLVTDLENLGYHISPQVLDASDFGVPQTRKRLFLLCDRERVPLKVYSPGNRILSAGDILDPEGKWGCTPLDNGKRATATLDRAKRAIGALGRGVPFLIVYYGSDGSGGWQPLDRPIRTLTTLDRFGLVTWSGDTPMLRMLQVSELRRAMGFDDTYILDKGSRRDRVKLLGNGVCPPVMKAIVRSLVGVEAAAQTSRDIKQGNPDVQQEKILDCDQMKDPLRQALDIVKSQARVMKMSAAEITTKVGKLTESLRTSQNCRINADG